MPSYKVTYFNARGRAETTRLALTLAGVPFEDERLSREQWQERKPDVPQQQLPVLYVDGECVPQSGAMLRCVARNHELYGKNIMEQTQVDVALETVEDFIKTILKVFFEKDEEKKKEYSKAFKENDVPRFSKLFEDILCKNQTGTSTEEEENKGWMVGDGITVADLAVFNIFNSLDKMFNGGITEAFSPYPNLKRNYEKVLKTPSIAQWIANRPVTET